jgi:hypothetical protein
LSGQAEVLDHLPSVNNAALVRGAAERIDAAQTTKELRELEAEGAIHYWRAWEGITVGFARKDADHVPKHWGTFGTRSSPLTHSARLAANPANAVLNYLYGILETEARIACHAMGLDPSVGLLHADLEFRDSFLFDLMEAARSRVDAFLLETLRSQVFRRDDFVETPQGACRLTPDLAKRIAEMAPRLAQIIGPTVERVVHMLITPTIRSGRPVPTRLTEANRSAGRKSAKPRDPNPTVHPAPVLPRACRICAVILEDPNGRLYCDTCLPKRRREADRVILASGAEALRQLRERGQDPAHGGVAAAARGANLSRNRRLAHAWEVEHPGPRDTQHFRTAIFPLLRRITVGEMARATGLTTGYCSMIRQGTYIPHPRHWETLRVLALARD